MFSACLKKECVIFIGLIVAVLLSPCSVTAKDFTFKCAGTARVTTPSGKVLTVEKNKTLSGLPAGSIIEVLQGSIEVEPGEGAVQLIVGNSFVTVEPDSRVKASLDTATEQAGFEVVAGQINVVTGNTTVLVKTGQEIRIGMDAITGVVQLKSIKGTVTAVTAGVKVAVSQGGVAKISADKGTKQVRVETTTGGVQVISAAGEVTNLEAGESVEEEGFQWDEIGELAEPPAKEVQLPEAEPADPEVPEASPHSP
ncbi:MAG: hypothetical protein ABH952_03530 [Candidatus Omnitrophota bacterium]